MSFLVVAAGHSGTRLFAFQLGGAPGWQVEHEPDGTISARLAEKRFAGRDCYGEVNSFLLTAARHISVTHRGVLLRDPYEVVSSVLRSKSFLRAETAINYVRESVSILDGLARDGWQVFRFKGITRSRKYVVKCASALGITTLQPEVVRLSRVNHHAGDAWDQLNPVSYPEVVRREFDQFNYLYGLL